MFSFSFLSSITHAYLTCSHSSIFFTISAPTVSFSVPSLRFFVPMSSTVRLHCLLLHLFLAVQFPQLLRPLSLIAPLPHQHLPVFLQSLPNALPISSVITHISRPLKSWQKPATPSIYPGHLRFTRSSPRILLELLSGTSSTVGRK